jgi:very-short-patch-repair endonuclease
VESRQGIRQARRLRGNTTDAEKVLWIQLRNRRLGNYKFRRQFAISGFIADFVCLESKLIVEVDGGQHAEQAERDEARSDVLGKSGFRVLRFWNNDVLERLDHVAEEILRHFQAPPSPQPSPASGRGGQSAP